MARGNKSGGGRGRGRGRGGGRGGRGRSRGGRGGRRQASLQESEGSKTAYYNKQFAQLMDLEADSYIPSVKNSMKALSRRPHKSKGSLSFFKEADYTSSHLQETLDKPLRKYHIEFVKAAEIYDPSAELIKKLSNVKLTTPKQEDQMETATVENSDSLATTGLVSEEASIEECIDTAIQEWNFGKQPENKETGEYLLVDENEEAEEATTTIDEDILDDHEEILPTSGHRVATNELPSDFQNIHDESDNSIVEIRVGKFLAEPEVDSEGDMYITLPSTSARSRKKANGLSFIQQKEQEYDDFRFDNESSDDSEDSYYKDSIRDYISNVMKNTLRKSSDSDESDGESDSGPDEYDLANSNSEEEEVDEDSKSDIEVDEMEESTDEEFENDNESSNQKIDFIKHTQENDATVDEMLDNDPEFGFLPEDYEVFDVSRIKVQGVRKGANEVLYDTVSTLFFGDSESRWIDREEFIDLAIDFGLPEYRINAFMKFILGDFDDDESDGEDDFEEDDGLEFIYDSSPDEDLEENLEAEAQGWNESESDSEMDMDPEELRHMAAFANSKRVDPLDIGTKSLKTKGKGKNMKLVLSDDIEMRQDLLNQFLFRNSSKRDKRKSKKEDRAAMDEINNDLLVKYPYEMRVKEMILEFKLFYKDQERVALRFPPLDPHGNRTLTKIADKYHMAHRKLGRGQHTFVVAIKSRKTYKRSPDYQVVDKIIKQRPIFNRTDTKKPKGVIEKEKKDKQTHKGRSGASNTGNYSEGSVVAANAPEIAHDNIGRKLLQKMGWQTGTSLGIGNEGIIEPIVAKMKKSKAGISVQKDSI